MGIKCAHLQYDQYAYYKNALTSIKSQPEPTTVIQDQIVNNKAGQNVRQTFKYEMDDH